MSLNLAVYQGSSFNQILTGNLNLSGYAIRSKIKIKYSNQTALAAFDYNITDAANGLVTISLPSTTTASLPVIRGVYDVEAFASGDLNVVKIADGFIDIYPEATSISGAVIYPNTGDQFVGYYLNSNPSGFITSGQATDISGALVSQIQAGVAGVSALNSGIGALNIVVGSNMTLSVAGQNIVLDAINTGSVGGSITGDYVKSFNGQTGIVTLDTGIFYLKSNPSGFITGNLANYATTANLQTTGSNLQNQINILNNNTGNYYNKNNPSGFITNTSLAPYVSGVIGQGNITASINGGIITISGNDVSGSSIVGGGGLTTGDADNRYVPLTGNATVIGPITFSGTYINFQNLTNPSYNEGRVFYDTGAHTLAYYNDSSQMTVNVGQETIVRITNKLGYQINNGQALYINGSQGNRPTANLAIANGEAAHKTIGLATVDIADNADGYLTVRGLVNGLNTTGLNEGDIVYLSPTVSGGWTNTEPPAPYHNVQIGVCTRSHVNQGSIFVSVHTASDLGKLNDVMITGLANGHMLYYNSASGFWQNLPSFSGVLASGIAATGQSLQNQITTLNNTTGFLSDRAYVESTSGVINNRLYQTGQTLISLIGGASAGVSSLNGLSGILNIGGLGNITVTTGAGTVYISGNDISGASTTYVDNAIINASGAISVRLTTTGANLQGQINTINNTTGGFYLSNNPSGFITGDLSQYATSANLQTSGSFLNSKINSLSGVSVLTYGDQFVDGTKTFTGIYLNRISTTGNSSVIRFDIGTFVSSSQNTLAWGSRILSGDWINNSTGISDLTLMTLGRVTGISGALDARLQQTGSYLFNLIGGSSAGVTSIDGLSGIIDLQGTGSVILTTGVNFLRLSGIDYSGNILSASGALDTKLTSTGLNFGLVSGALNTKIIISGASGITYTNNVSGALNARLTSSGSLLFNLVTGAVTSVNTLSGSIRMTGDGNIIIFTTGANVLRISGDTSSLATTTNLALTGSGLQTQINNISTGNFYPRTNPSGYLTGINSGIYITGAIGLGSVSISGISNQILYISGAAGVGGGITGDQYRIDRTITGIIAGTNTTVSNNGNGTFTVNSTATAAAGGSSVSWRKLLTPTFVPSTTSSPMYTNYSGVTSVIRSIFLYNTTATGVNCQVYNVPNSGGQTGIATQFNRLFNMDIPSYSTVQIGFGNGMVLSSSGSGSANDAIFASATTTGAITMSMFGDLPTSGTHLRLKDVGYLGSLNSGVITNPAGKTTELKTLVFHNIDSSTQTVNYYYVPNNGGSTGVAISQYQMAAIVLLPNDTFIWDLSDDVIRLEGTNDSIQMSATTSGKVIVCGYGAQA